MAATSTRIWYRFLDAERAVSIKLAGDDEMDVEEFLETLRSKGGNPLENANMSHVVVRAQTSIGTVDLLSSVGVVKLVKEHGLCETRPLVIEVRVPSAAARRPQPAFHVGATKERMSAFKDHKAGDRIKAKDRFHMHQQQEPSDNEDIAPNLLKTTKASDPKILKKKDTKKKGGGKNNQQARKKGKQAVVVDLVSEGVEEDDDDDDGAGLLANKKARTSVLGGGQKRGEGRGGRRHTGKNLYAGPACDLFLMDRNESFPKVPFKVAELRSEGRVVPLTEPPQRPTLETMLAEGFGDKFRGHFFLFTLKSHTLELVATGYSHRRYPSFDVMAALLADKNKAVVVTLTCAPADNFPVDIAAPPDTSTGWEAPVPGKALAMVKTEYSDVEGEASHESSDSGSHESSDDEAGSGSQKKESETSDSDSDSGSDGDTGHEKKRGGNKPKEVYKMGKAGKMAHQVTPGKGYGNG
jgi:hypothetical protein